MNRFALAVVGLNLGHDNSACVARDGRVVTAIAEERLSRRKHEVPLNMNLERYCSFPHRSFEYCLSGADLSVDQIDLVVASTSYVRDASGNRRALTPDDVVAQRPELSNTKVRIANHHLSHAASAAWCSPFTEATVLVVDGSGSIVGIAEDGSAAEVERTSAYRFTGGNLTLLRKSTGRAPSFGNSLGNFYQIVTRYLGFGHWTEGKTMAFAAFRDMQRPAASWRPLEQFQDAIVVNDVTDLEVKPAFQYTAEGDFHSELVRWFGAPRNSPRVADALDRHIASSAQWALERALVGLATSLYRLDESSALCMAGGVALNCVANRRILDESPFDTLFVQPAASDDGTALGNALLGTRWLDESRTLSCTKLPYLGRSYDDDEVAAAVADVSDRVEALPVDRLAEEVARAISRGAVTAVFQGGSEFGPRALGHRSILADPRLPWMKDHLNSVVKHREAFRPFAPIVLAERAAEFFDLDTPSPYMSLAAPVRRPETIPAVTHVDGTARVQTIAATQEPLIYAIVAAFEEITGLPVLLNTSFNDAGEPIVETPRDALKTFLSTSIDVLFLGGLRVSRRGSHGRSTPISDATYS